MIGLPGSGKSTVARELGRVQLATVIVSRDDIRSRVFGNWKDYTFSPDQEELVTKIEEIEVESSLKLGLNVIIDAMHIRRKYRQKWAKVAHKHGADFNYVDLTGVDLQLCIWRDESRGDRGERYVGAEFIRSYHKKYFHGNVPVETPESLIQALGEVPKCHDPYEPVPGLPEAVIVDIDGTVAKCQGVRNPYDTTNYHLDRPNPGVIRIVQDMAYRTVPKKILFVSGRDEKFRNVTEDWLYEHVKVPIEGFFMRPEGDTRRDDIVKLELFDKHIRGNYNIAFVLDDRDRVVKAWRSIHLLTLQVSEGDF